MDEHIHIEIPNWVDIDDLEDLRDYLNSEESLEQLYPALDLQTGIDRAVVDDVSISDLERDSNILCISYDFSYSAYYGCKDMNVADCDSRSIEAEIDDKTIILDRFVPPEKLAPNEEF